jgi:hypothetical protein
VQSRNVEEEQGRSGVHLSVESSGRARANAQGRSDDGAGSEERDGKPSLGLAMESLPRWFGLQTPSLSLVMSLKSGGLGFPNSSKDRLAVLPGAPSCPGAPGGSFSSSVDSIG